MPIYKTRRFRKKDGKWVERWRADAGIDPVTKRRRRKVCDTYAQAKQWLQSRVHAHEDALIILGAGVGGAAGAQDQKAQLTLSQLGIEFVADRKAAGRERSTWEKYDQHFKQHIAKLAYAWDDKTDPKQDQPRDGILFGDMVAAELRARHFVKLRRALQASRSHEMVLKVWSTLCAALDLGVQIEAVEANIARSVKIDRQPRRAQEKVVIPTRPEIALLYEKTRPSNAEPIYIGQAMIATTVTSGLRPSEMRALPWPCLSIDAQPFSVTVTERVDQWRQAGPPKSAAGYREIPLPESTARILREWRMRCPKGPKNLVFPNSDGGYQDLSNIHRRIWRPFQVAIGLADPKLDKKGEPLRDEAGAPILEPRYSWYALRHAYASMQIAIGIKPKQLQQRMGHASIQITLDTYGHLWTDQAADAADMAALDVFMKNLPREG